MKRLCVAFILLSAAGFASECSRHKKENHRTIHEVIPTQFKEFVNDIGFSVHGKSDEEIKQEFPLWMAKIENQDRFLTKLTNQMKGGSEAVPEEMVEVLDSIKNGMRLWAETLNAEKKTPKKIRPFFSGIENLTLSCSKKNCHCCRECDSLEEEIEAMRDEVADLKSAAGETFAKAGWEAAGAGVTIAAGQPELAIVPAIYASRDFVSACETYNEAVELEKRVDDLEKFIREQQGIEEDKSSKSWWPFWK
jgi:polyhydroxyalkanoate synthesis regulator phasin